MQAHSETGKFLKSEAFLGLLIILSFFAAVLVSNIPLFYQYYLKIAFAPVTLLVGSVIVHSTILEIINDALMSLFFLLIGMEMKLYFALDECKSKRKLILPIAAALGGFFIPALIYIYFNYNVSTVRGWAVPVATDTAFIMGILSFFKHLISLDLRGFVITFSIIDDILALLALAFFYNQATSFMALLIVAFLILSLCLLSYLGVKKAKYYLIIGLLLWLAMIKAGLHGTLAGCIVALFIPVTFDGLLNPSFSNLENWLRPLVNYIIVPLFIFMNSGIPFHKISLTGTCSNISLGIILGLFIGKQLGITLLSYIVIACKLAQLPTNTSWLKFYSIAVLGGIGFTMSFFIGDIAFENICPANDMRSAVIIGSTCSAIYGIILLLYIKHRYN